jgi:hypothetical protein
MRTNRHPASPAILALLLILAGAAALRLWHIDTLPPGFHFDESFEGLEAWRILTDPSYRPVFLTGNFGVPPLNAYANAVMFGLFQLFGGEAGPTAMRVTAAFFGVLGVAAVFALGHEMSQYDPRLSPAYPLLAAAVLGLMRWHVHFSRIGIEPILMPLEWAAATWLLLRGWRTGSRLSFAGCGVVLAACMYTYQGAWVIPLLVAVTALLLWWEQSKEGHIGGARSVPPSLRPSVVLPKDASQGGFAQTGPSVTNDSAPRSPLPAPHSPLRGLLLTALVAGLLVAPLAWFLLHNPDLLLLRPSQIAITGQATEPAGFWSSAWATLKMFFPFGQTGDLDPRRNLPGAPALSVWLAVPFWIGLVMAAWRIRRPVYAMLVIGLTGMLLPGMISDYAPHFHRVLGAAAPVALLSALPLAWIWENGVMGLRNAGMRTGRALVLLLLVLAAATTVRDYFVRWAALPDLYYAFDQGLWDVGQWIAQQPIETPIYLTPRDSGHATLAFAWRSGTGSHPRPVSFDGRKVFPLTEGPASQAERYVVIEHEDFRTPLLLPEIFPQATVEQEFHDAAGQTYARVYSRAAGSAPQADPQHFVDAPLGDGIRLLGYDTIPSTPQPGDILVVRLYWQVDTRPSGDWTTFNHLIGPAKADGSSLWAGYDSQPGGGSLPTSRWQPGWRIIDEYPIPLPADLPAGSYTLEIGLYQPAGARLPVDGSGVILGRVDIQAR